MRCRRLVIFLIPVFCGLLFLLRQAGAAPDSDTRPQGEPSLLDSLEQNYLDGRYEEVIRQANLLLDENPSMNEARFLRGTAYWKRGKTGAAARDLEEYMKRGGRFEKEAGEILEQQAATRTGPTKFLRYGLRAGVLHNDRVVRTELARDDLRRYSTDSGLRLDWSLESGTVQPWTLKYRGSTLSYFEVTPASWLAESLDLIGRWAVAEGRGALELRLGGKYIRKDAGPDLWRASSRVEMAWAVDHRHVGWIAVEAAYDDYPTDSGFNGVPYLAEIGIDHRFAQGSVYVDVYGLIQEADLDAVSHFESGVRLGVGWCMTDRLSVGLVLQASDAEFDNYDFLFSTERSDFYYSAETWAAYRMGKGCRARPFIEYGGNESNIEGDDYERLIFGLDLIWGAL